MTCSLYFVIALPTDTLSGAHRLVFPTQVIGLRPPFRFFQYTFPEHDRTKRVEVRSFLDEEERVLVTALEVIELPLGRLQESDLAFLFFPYSTKFSRAGSC